LVSGPSNNGRDEQKEWGEGLEETRRRNGGKSIREAHFIYFNFK
jgi:hypothetical protein